jgi:mono/diheme cytochrome c family protein
MLCLGLLGMGLASSQGPTATKAPSPSEAAFFESKIRPLFVEQCYSCHGPGTQLSGLRLDSIGAILKGGNQGPAIVPGDPDRSLLIQAVKQTGKLKMPQGGVLKPEQVADLVAWVKMGAPWPQDSKGKPAAPDLWSLEPVRMPALPKVKNAAWVRNPVDAFVLADLESKHLRPAPLADKRTLLRRVTYDLTGLPPTVDELIAFLADKSPDAYDKVVARLLASPHYGERWARHWLDVARYSDTKGYVFNEDRNYYNAYTYRNWVIDAFNHDLPYNQFIIDQLAADKLPNVGEDPKPLAAMGFLTVGRRFLNSQPDIIDDRIDTTMRGFEGLTVACARCHDHKFDPIPTQDYYSLYSVFADSTDKEIPISDKSISQPYEAYVARLDQLQNQMNGLSLAQCKALRQEIKDNKPVAPQVKQVLQALGEQTPATGEELKKLMPSFDPAASKQIEHLAKDIQALNASAPAKPELAMAMVDVPNPGDGVVFKRGNPGNRGDEAPRRFLLALSKNGERTHWTDGSGRLELAQAIASKDNPLTSRVYVNRVWQDHFGRGLVGTPSDFGHQGERPTNQPLLDYLAATFMENGWSVKKLQTLIVTSNTYRQSSDADKQAYMVDPENRSFGRMNRRRLDLEEMRDTLMEDAGKLDLADVGGKSVELWTQPFTNRRAVYGFIERQNLPGTFRTFDYATPDATSARRFETTVPQQALFFMNSPFVVEAAEDVAARPQVMNAKSDGQRIKALYALIFQRSPNQTELELGGQYLESGGSSAVESPNDVWSYGYGLYDEQKGRTASFTPITTYADGFYRVGKVFPDPTLGYISLRPNGGHPGRDQAHAVIRRWTAPGPMTISISGMIAHGEEKGDGVRARIVSSRSGLLGEWKAHHSSSPTEVSSLNVLKGDTIDFIVDPMANDAYDSFAWAPVVQTKDGAQVWNAEEMSAPGGRALTRLVLYAQALLETNEFMFID